MYGGDGGKKNDMELLGIPAEFAGSFEEKLCDVWLKNWKTVELFIALGTQWRVGMGGPTGLDYSVIPVVAKAMQIKLTPGRFDGIRAMEGEALRVMGAESKKK